MSKHYSRKDFDEHLNTKFRVPFESGATAELELIQTNETTTSPRQEQFSTIFRGPLEFFLPQGTYYIQHDGLGEMNLFLVPVGREEDGFRYEAAFNYLLDKKPERHEE